MCCYRTFTLEALTVCTMFHVLGWQGALKSIGSGMEQTGCSRVSNRKLPARLWTHRGSSRHLCVGAGTTGMTQQAQHTY